MTQFISPDVALLVMALGTGRDNAVSRAELAEKLGVSDREMRKLVEQARAAGYLIINEQSGKGYYLAADADDAERQYRQMTSRAMAILKSRAPFRKYLKSAGRDVK